LYNYAEDQNHDVYWYSFGPGDIESLSVQDPDGKCYIALDPYRMCSIADELCKGLHELGHCETGSFYNQYSAYDIRQKHENCADKWAIEHCISKEDFAQALKEGCTEIWDLSERFGVTEDFMRKTTCWYTRGNLATNLYE
jgi:hypothetical protein